MMPSTLSTYSSNIKDEPDEDVLRNLRHMVKRSDRRGSYHIKPTWLINGIPISRCASPDLSSTLQGKHTGFGRLVSGLRSPELREVIMNACLKDIGIHRDVVEMLREMQQKRPQPIISSIDHSVRNPTAGLYLYCRSQRELVQIVLDLAKRDDAGTFRQDVRDLVMVLREADAVARY